MMHHEFTVNVEEKSNKLSKGTRTSKFRLQIQNCAEDKTFISNKDLWHSHSERVLKTPLDDPSQYDITSFKDKTVITK